MARAPQASPLTPSSTGLAGRQCAGTRHRVTVVPEVIDVTDTSVQEPTGPQPFPSGDRRQTGRRGEDLAAAYLTDLGWTVLERNWRPRGLAGLRGEIDIVASEPSASAGRPTLVVVEVKTRSTVAVGTPAEAVTPAKRRRLARLAAAWLADHGGSGRRLRLDVISILLRDPLPAQLRHHRGVWS